MNYHSTNTNQYMNYHSANINQYESSFNPIPPLENTLEPHWNRFKLRFLQPLRSEVHGTLLGALVRQVDLDGRQGENGWFISHLRTVKDGKIMHDNDL